MKKKILVMLLTVTMGISLLTGCGEGAKTETVTDAENSMAEVKETTEVEEPKKQTITQWSESLNYSEPVLGIWNMNDTQGEILEDGQEYELLEGDKIFVYSSKEYGDLELKEGPKTVKSLANYGTCTIIEYENYKQKNNISIMIKDVAGKDYELKACIIYPDAVDDVSEEVISFDEWTKELNETLKECKFIVYNTISGDKKILENEEEYLIQEGDKLGIIVPKGFGLMELDEENTLSEEIRGYAVCFELVDQEKTEYEVLVMKLENGENIKLYATFLQ